MIVALAWIGVVLTCLLALVLALAAFAVFCWAAEKIVFTVFRWLP